MRIVILIISGILIIYGIVSFIKLDESKKRKMRSPFIGSYYRLGEYPGFIALVSGFILAYLALKVF